MVACIFRRFFILSVGYLDRSLSRYLLIYLDLKIYLVSRDSDIVCVPIPHACVCDGAFNIECVLVLDKV